MSQKSILAKLLATENISVQHGNYETAWFDIKNRILGLPQWVDKGKDVSDLLIGHEVGHALETPYEGWHDSPEKLEGCPRTYINVIEDARIERKIKSRYVGLVGPFQRGYKTLFEDEFFGNFDNRDWSQTKLIDKINLRAKVGAHLEIPFNKEEEVLFQRTMTTDTFDEVLQVVRDVLAYTKENEPELIQPPKSDTPQLQDDEMFESDKEEGMGPSGHDDWEDETQQAQSEKEDDESDEELPQTDESGEATQSDDTDRSEQAEEKESKIKAKPDEDESLTDKAFRDREKDLLDVDEEGRQNTVIRGMSKKDAQRAVISYSKLKEERTANPLRAESLQEEIYGKYIDDFTVYMKEAKKSVNFAVKEFEQRKAAYRWTRAETARTGSINVNKLWSYKTDDDIFARVTRLADAKNHGLIGIIDYSGSMHKSMGHVLDQVIYLSMFCKAVNIPFDIYGFTTQNLNWNQKEDGGMEFDHLSMPQIVSSSLKKADYDAALFHCYIRKQLGSADYWDYSYDERMIMGKSEEYGSTPLNQALSVSHHLVDAFRTKHGVDKMNLVVISDGDTNGTSGHKAYFSEEENVKISYTPLKGYYNGEVTFHQSGKVFKASNSRRGLTTALLQNLQRKGVNTLGFFITEDSYQWKNQLGRVFTGEDYYNEYEDDYREFYKDANKEYRKNKCFTTNKLAGYDEYYIIKGSRNLKTAEEEFAPEADATKGQITQAFKKHSKSKKNNKVLLTNFGRAVA